MDARNIATRLTRDQPDPQSTRGQVFADQYDGITQSAADDTGRSDGAPMDGNVRPPPRLPRLGTESRLVALAVGTWAVHVATETVLRAGHATVQERLEPIGVASVLAVLALIAFGRPGLVLRAAIAVLIGVAAAANGAVHVYDLTVHRHGTGLAGRGSTFAEVVRDVGGVATLVAGIWLLGLAIVLLWRTRLVRAPGPRSWLRRCARAVAAVVVTLALLLLVVFPVGLGTVQTHRLQHASTGPVPPGYQDVEFVASDGVELSGWYHPSRNGAAVLLVPSASGTRDSVRAHAHLLVKHGYGVLAYDARGSGASEGVRNAYGWGWRADVDGGVRFLSTQPDVQPGHIGGIGLSTGADVLIETTSAPVRGGDQLAAVVADGATARSAGDLAPLEPALSDTLSDLPLRVTFSVISLLSGTRPGPPLRQLAAHRRVHSPPMLLVASGSIPQEIPLNRRYASAAQAQLWTLPKIAHTRGIYDAHDYEDRVVGFLDHALHVRHVEPRTNP